MQYNHWTHLLIEYVTVLSVRILSVCVFPVFILIVFVLCQWSLLCFLCLFTSDQSQPCFHLFPILSLSCLCILVLSCRVIHSVHAVFSRVPGNILALTLGLFFSGFPDYSVVYFSPPSFIACCHVINLHTLFLCCVSSLCFLVSSFQCQFSLCFTLEVLVYFFKCLFP